MFDEVHSVPSPPRRQALTRADSGNVRESRMTLNVKLRQSINEEAKYDGRATCSVYQTLHVACSVIHVSSRAFGDAF